MHYTLIHMALYHSVQHIWLCTTMCSTFGFVSQCAVHLALYHNVQHIIWLCITMCSTFQILHLVLYHNVLHIYTQLCTDNVQHINTHFFITTCSTFICFCHITMYSTLLYLALKSLVLHETQHFGVGSYGGVLP